MNKLLSSLCSQLDLKPEHTELLNERDTSDVWRQFAIWLLVDEEHGVLRFTNPGTPQYKAIQQVAQLYIEDCKDADAWKAAAKAASSAAAYAAYAAAAAKAAYYAAYADDASSSSASSAAYYAAYAAADDASSSAASYAAYYAAEAAYAAYASSAAAYADYERMADKLIELINAAPLKEPV